MKVAVLGPGGVGGFVAAALTCAGTDTVVVARPETAAAIEREGIAVESVRLGGLRASPRAVAELSEPVDALIVATKATSLEVALERVRADVGVVVPLLNGVDHLALLRRRFGERVVAAAIRIESERVAAGRIVQSSPFLAIHLAGSAPGLTAALERAGIPVEYGSEPDVMWRKLVRLNALALTTTAFGEPLGQVRSRPELEACVREAAAVANAEGASVDPNVVMAELDAAHATLSSSMARDVAAGAEPELDAIAGAVLRAAQRHGLKCATVSRLAERVGRLAIIAPCSRSSSGSRPR